MFWFKKLISAWLLPLPIALVLLLIGLVLLGFSQRKTAAGCVLVAFLLVLVFSLNITANTLLRPLEYAYPVLRSPPAGVHTIVVLGAKVQRVGSGDVRLGSSALSRLVEGVRLYRQMQKKSPLSSTLIVSGAPVLNMPSSARAMAQWAEALGIPRQQIVLENHARDTGEEALDLRTRLKGQSFILVTSAFHMPRAMELFKRRGLKPIPAPTQFLTNVSDDQLAPTASSLVRCDIAIHEYLGIFWERHWAGHAVVGALNQLK